MDLRLAIARASRGMREEAGLHLVAISSLTIAFLALGTALVVIANLSVLADTWGRSARLTVYLHDGAADQDVAQLRLALDSVDDIESVELLSSAQAREQFLRDSQLGAELSELPAEAFPASLEIQLAPGAQLELAALAERVRAFDAVEDIETYEGYFHRLDALVAAGRSVSLVLAVLVILCVVFVVGNTIRLAVAGRRDEIEVMKLCGASDGFVRGPFIIEGAVQGLVSAIFALAILAAAYLTTRGQVEETLSVITGTRFVFLSPIWSVALVGSGAILGAAGSVLSLRRYLSV